VFIISTLQSYTQYIPMSLYDLQTWMGSPSIYVYDCSHAGQIIDSFEQFSYQRDSEFMMLNVSVYLYVYGIGHVTP